MTINFIIIQSVIMLCSITLFYGMAGGGMLNWLFISFINLAPPIFYFSKKKRTAFALLSAIFWLLLGGVCVVLSLKVFDFVSINSSEGSFPKAQIVILSILLIALTICFVLINRTISALEYRIEKYSLFPDKSAETFIFIVSAVLLTNLFYLVLFFNTKSESSNFIWELFLERGIIPYIITTFTCWAILLIVQRYARIRYEKMIFDAHINPDFQGHPLERFLYAYFQSSVVEERLKYTNALLKKGNTAGEVSTLLNESLPAQQQSYFANYNILNYLTWSIPVLGFIGTVWGISKSIEEIVVALARMNNTSLAEQSSSDFLGSAVEPLAVAFDTTLLALSLSAFIMLFVAFIRRWEERFFSDLEQYTHGLVSYFYKKI